MQIVGKVHCCAHSNNLHQDARMKVLNWHGSATHPRSARVEQTLLQRGGLPADADDLDLESLLSVVLHQRRWDTPQRDRRLGGVSSPNHLAENVRQQNAT